jgi:hypothetical protein
LISKGLQTSIRCGTHRGVELILEHSIFKKIPCQITESEVRHLLECQNYDVMNVLLYNGVNYVQKISKSHSLVNDGNNEKDLKRIIKVPTLL